MSVQKHTNTPTAMDNGAAKLARTVMTMIWKWTVNAANTRLTKNVLLERLDRNVVITRVVSIYKLYYMCNREIARFFLIDFNDIELCIIVVKPPPGPPSECKDEGKHCPYWRDQGYCIGTHSTYMKKYCKKSCDVC